MPSHLERRYGTERLHFITCSCYRRMPLLNHDRISQMFLSVLEDIRQKYGFYVCGYVIMPEHFHLLISEPETGDPGTVMQVLKQRVSHQGLKLLHSNISWWPNGSRSLGGGVRNDGPPKTLQFWQTRFYDFNVWSQAKKVEKLKYMHRNPVRPGAPFNPSFGLSGIHQPSHPRSMDLVQTSGAPLNPSFGLSGIHDVGSSRDTDPPLPAPSLH